MLDSVWQDIRYAARSLGRTPGFSLVAILTLALGIGATTALFSVVYGVLLKPLPFDEPERLVNVSHRIYSQGPGTYFTYRDNAQAFEDIGAWESIEVTIAGRGEPEQIEALSVTDATLGLLRVQPVLGRLFSAQDDAPGSALRVILTHGYWQRRFGGATNVIGEFLEVDGRPAEVIGVLPASFTLLRTDPVVLLPMQLDRADPTTFDFGALARLRDGVTIPQANADVARMIPLLPQQYAAFDLQPSVQPLADSLIGGVSDMLWILLAAAGVVLLIAGANVANLLLVRAEGRQQELAMRTALGAARGDIVRALLSESVLVAVVAGVLSIILAQVVLAILRETAPAQLPRVEDIAMNAQVVLFAVAVSLISGVLFGLIPGLKFARASTAVLNDNARGSTDAPRRHRTRKTLVVAQVALSLVLLVASGLMIRTFVAMRTVDPGFTAPDRVQTFRVAIPEHLIGDPEQVVRIHEGIAERLAQIPGIESVGLSSSITMDGENNTNPLIVEGERLLDDQLPPFRRFKTVAPGYFRTMGNRLVAGRPISWLDTYQRRPVVVISETLAREYWGNPFRALGQRVRYAPDQDWHEIVGVSGDERDDGLNQPVAAIVYWPMLNDRYEEFRIMAYAVRSDRVGAAGFVREIHEAVWSVNANLPVAAVRTLDDIRAASMAQTSFAMMMLAIAGGMALFLGVVGIYGVIAYVVKQRTREIGIRLALGAQIGEVRKLFLRHALRLTAAGITVGIAMALLLTRAVSGLLFGVAPTDAATYTAVSALLAVVALVASYLPAQRVSRVDPVIALRAE